MARYTLLHDTHQLGLIRREAPFKARHTPEEKRLWLGEYRQKILDEYKAMTGEDPVRSEWNLNGIHSFTVHKLFQPPPMATAEAERRAKVQLSRLKHLNYTDDLR